jgi:hypothetical protein
LFVQTNLFHRLPHPCGRSCCGRCSSQLFYWDF